MLSKPDFDKLDKIFPIRQWTLGATLEELAANAGERKVIDKLRTMVNSQGFIKG